MEEQFILRVPPSVAERIDRLLIPNPTSGVENSVHLSFQDGRTGSFTIGENEYPVSLLDLPGVIESYKTYDDTVLIKTADIGQIIMVREPNESPQEGLECKNGLAPPMRDARKKRFRREPDLNPEFVQKVENELQSIMSGTNWDDVEVVEQEDDDETPAEVPVTQPILPQAEQAVKSDAPLAEDESTSEDDEDDEDD